jgi:hypothetical protein
MYVWDRMSGWSREGGKCSVYICMCFAVDKTNGNAENGQPVRSCGAKSLKLVIMWSKFPSASLASERQRSISTITSSSQGCTHLKTKISDIARTSITQGMVTSHEISTNSMVQSPPLSRSAGEDIPACYVIRGSLPCSQAESSPQPQAIFLFKIHSNIILPFTPRSPKWPLSIRFSD